MYGLNNQLSTAENYRRFARLEAAGRSPTYERLALFVADSPLLLDFLGQLPTDKRQPNLLFAAARYLLGTPADTNTHQGGPLNDLERIAAGAPSAATLVVSHSAVLAYVDETKRAAFATAVAELGATWLSNEAPGIVAGVKSNGNDSGFLLIRNGRELLAYADPHGTRLHWVAEE